MLKEIKSSGDVFIADGAKVLGNVVLGSKVNVWHNAVIRGENDRPVIIGECSNVQECAVIHNTTTLGKYVTIGHGAIVHGCTIGDNVMVGMGAIVLDGAKIGDNCMVAAGALVTGKTDAPAGSMLVGNPAKIIRPLTEAEIIRNTKNAEHYLQLAEEELK